MRIREAAGFAVGSWNRQRPENPLQYPVYSREQVAVREELIPRTRGLSSPSRHLDVVWVGAVGATPEERMMGNLMEGETMNVKC